MKSWLLEHRYAVADTFLRFGRQPLSVLLNILVVGIALALPLAGYTLLTNLQPLTGRLASAPEISIFMHVDAKRSDAEALAPRLRLLQGIDRIEFVPRESAVERLKEQSGMKEVIGALGNNPFPDAWILHLRPPLGDPFQALPGPAAATAHEALATQLRALPKVEHVQVDSAWIRRLEALMNFLRLALGILAAALGVAVVAVIFNTIRLQVLTQREEIEVAKLIGATDRFVRRPFYYMGALQGLSGGALALLLVALALLPLNAAVSEFSRLYASPFSFTPLPPEEALAFGGLAILLGWLAAMLSVRRHLTTKRS